MPIKSLSERIALQNELNTKRQAAFEKDLDRIIDKNSPDHVAFRERMLKSRTPEGRVQISNERLAKDQLLKQAKVDELTVQVDKAAANLKTFEVVAKTLESKLATIKVGGGKISLEKGKVVLSKIDPELSQAKADHQQAAIQLRAAKGEHGKLSIALGQLQQTLEPRERRSTAVFKKIEKS